MRRNRLFKRLHVLTLFLVSVSSGQCFAIQIPGASESTAKPRDPVSVTLLQMDLTGAQGLLRRHDLDDDKSLNATELKRLAWTSDEVRRFDLNRNGTLQHLELALKLADGRIDDGIVQMDSTLAQRYMKEYDVNQDGKLAMSELSRNTFTDAPDSYDKNSDEELTSAELIRGLAFERKFRAELGIKGCDQGGAMKLINRGDTNGDRRIDADEIEQTGLKEDAFDFDRNDDGKLSVSELAERLADRRHRLGLTPSDQLAARGILRQMDRDGDGVIIVAEMPPVPATGMLSKSDLDGDGKVTELELERFFGKRRKELGFDDEDADRAATLIQRNDSDNSRSLSRSEMVASGSDRNSPLSPTKLPVIDEDHDGGISVNEFARYLKKTR